MARQYHTKEFDRLVFNILVFVANAGIAGCKLAYRGVRRLRSA